MPKDVQRGEIESAISPILSTIPCFGCQAHFLLDPRSGRRSESPNVHFPSLSEVK